MTTTTIIFGADLVITYVNANIVGSADTCSASVTVIGGERIDCQQLADTCSITAFADLATALPLEQLSDTCSVSIAAGVGIRINCQQARDSGAISAINDQPPPPLPINAAASRSRESFVATAHEGRFLVKER